MLKFLSSQKTGKKSLKIQKLISNSFKKISQMNISLIKKSFITVLLTNNKGSNY